MSRKATLDALFGRKAQDPAAAPETKAAGEPIGTKALGAPNTSADAGAGRIRSGAIGAMGASLQQLRDGAREAETLRRSLASGERVLELDPSRIDAAPVADRFRQQDDAAIAALAQSIRDSGQQVPVLVRPHPAAPDRWQAAYGHRRIRACVLAGVPVKALVRPLSDQELAIAQGKENLERRDLSFIEKAYFAAGLEAAGHERGVITQALAADKADVSRYVMLARAVPMALATLIGPAPKTGRPRWQELADALANRPAHAQPLNDLIANLNLHAGFEMADSDQRFRMVLARLKATPKAAAREPVQGAALVADAEGRPVAELKGEGRRRRIDLDDQVAPGFAAFVATAIPELYRRWRMSAAGDVKPNQE
jgi:ParB family transcriptional regulator, chromosome partitioning protein